MNNIEKFDDDFRFQITRTEYLEILGSKILALEQGKISKKREKTFFYRATDRYKKFL